MANWVLTPKQFERDLKHQVMAMAPAKRRRFMRKVVVPTMVNMVLIRFLRGGYLAAGDWLSNARETKLGGRWAKDYKKRPSGQLITADKIRLVDSGNDAELANSYRGLEVTANSATVGPGKTAHGGAGIDIAKQAETLRPAGWGNHIVGFTTEINEALKYEMQNYLDRMATGKEPPYLPKSRLGRRKVKVK